MKRAKSKERFPVPQRVGGVTELYPRIKKRTLGIQKFRDPDGTTYEQPLFLGGMWCVLVFPLTKKKEVVVLNQFRHGPARAIYELPGGNAEHPNDNPKKVAARELKEETGYAAERMIRLPAKTMWYDPSSYICDFHPFLALGCEKVCEPRVEEKFTSVVRFPFPRWIRMIRKGEVRDSKTIALTFTSLLMLGEMKIKI